MAEHPRPVWSSDHAERHEQVQSTVWMLILTLCAAAIVMVVGGAVGQPVLGVFAAVLMAILIALCAVVLAPARRRSYDAASSTERGHR